MAGLRNGLGDSMQPAAENAAMKFRFPTSDEFDRWRVMPRVLVALYGFVCWQTFVWFTALPDPTASQTTFATGIWGAAAAWFGFYVNSGGRVK